MHTSPRKASAHAPVRLKQAFNTISLSAALCALSSLSAAAQTAVAPAQSAAQDAAQAFNLPAGPLDAALYAFATQSGITLSFERALVEGLSTAGLQGRFDTEHGLAMLLGNTGLKAVRGVSGAWQLQRMAQPALAYGDAYTLKTVVVQGSAEASATTEGTGSYAPRQVTVGTKIPVPWKEVPASVSVVTRQQIEDQNLMTVEDALRQVVGVTTFPYGDGTAYFQARGYQSDVQYDGIPANNGLQYLSQFDLAMYDRIEVLRGPAGVLQGAGSPAGTVNMVRKRPTAEPSMGVTLSAGSWGRGRSELDISRPLNESGSVRGRVVLAGQSYGTFLDKGRDRSLMGYGVIEADLTPDTLLTLSATAQKRHDRGIDYGVGVHADGSFVRLPRSTFFGTDWSGADNTTREYFAELSHRFNSNWQAKVVYLDRSVDGNSRYGYVNPGPGFNYHSRYTLQAQDGDTLWRGLDANISGKFDLAGMKHEVVLGFNQAWRRQTSLSGNVQIPDVDLHNIQVPERPIPFKFGSNSRSEQSGIYGQLRTHLTDRLTLTLGGRLSRYESRSQNILPTVGQWQKDPGVGTQFTPQVALVYDVQPNISVYGSYTEIFQPQTQLALGNAALKPREGKQFEVGSKGVFLNGQLNASIAAFQINDENRAIADPNNPTFYVASGKVRSQGWEVEVAGRIRPGWDIYAGYTRLLTRYIDDPTQLGAIYSAEEPRNSFKLWTRYEFQNKDLRGWFLGAGVRAQSTTNRGADPQRGYAVFDAQVGYRINRNLLATVNVNNLFDKAYYARVPSRFYSVWGEPRNVMVTLRASY
ncbi:TonB-dependent siderophore receptor [Variovorax sp. 22077]|uniref:TonB-dependent siderophore receptor n=1 Tax=Variovorax sp. 22077 TaxID=3453867 RepID=UPI003F85578E